MIFYFYQIPDSSPQFDTVPSIIPNGCKKEQFSFAWDERNSSYPYFPKQMPFFLQRDLIEHFHVYDFQDFKVWLKDRRTKPTNLAPNNPQLARNRLFFDADGKIGYAHDYKYVEKREKYIRSWKNRIPFRIEPGEVIVKGISYPYARIKSMILDSNHPHTYYAYWYEGQEVKDLVAIDPKYTYEVKRILRSQSYRTFEEFTKES